MYSVELRVVGIAPFFVLADGHGSVASGWYSGRSTERHAGQRDGEKLGTHVTTAPPASARAAALDRQPVRGSVAAASSRSAQAMKSVKVLRFFSRRPVFVPQLAQIGSAANVRDGMITPRRAG